ncbi:MAG: response regulator transcription factor [Methylococcaceae bacterium]|nr:response regulator transcription factor [Methylococcaceae bacterium]
MNSEFSQDHKSIVMIVDDTPGNLALLSDTLLESGYRVLVATDGISALEQIHFLTPDIILLDVMMPGINGFETCHRLKADPKTAVIPVIFMTALSELDDLLRGFDEGAVDYVVKPIRPPEVLARVEAHLNQARNIQRAENALNNSPYSALTITADGQLTWLSESGSRWLCEVLQLPISPDTIKVGSQLPTPIREWFKDQLKNPENIEHTAFERAKGGARFSLKLTSCPDTEEYLLLMEKRSGQWNLEAVKNSLGLTFREAEILMWISRGKTNKEVGLILGSSPRTVNKHLEHIFEKLGVFTRAAAVSMAMQRTANLNAIAEAV